MQQSFIPRPSVVLYLVSAVVLAACVFAMSAAIAMVAVAWDPVAQIAGILFFPFPTALAIQQYRGTFRHNARAAFAAAVMLCFVGGIAVFACAMTLGELILQNVRSGWARLLLPMLVTGVACCLAAWMNLRWSRRLRQFPPAAASVVAQFQFTVRKLVAATTAIACVTALTTHFIRTAPTRYAENVSRDSAPFGLPTEAREISFCQGYRGTIAYEFTIDENGFVAWIENEIGSLESGAANLSVQPITEPFTIQRYFALTQDLVGPNLTTITNGLYYDWSHEDRGVHAAFDRTTNRAYYYSHFH